jgi:hypothetical protein
MKWKLKYHRLDNTPNISNILKFMIYIKFKLNKVLEKYHAFALVY